MKKTLILACAAVISMICAANAFAQPRFSRNEVIEIWPDGAPNSNGDTSTDAPVAKLTIYPAMKPN